MKPLTILVRNPAWMTHFVTLGDSCLPVDITFDESRESEADAVVFHIPSHRPEPDARPRPGQLWVAFSLESDHRYPILRNPEFMRRFDLTMTYRLDSDVCAPYFHADFVKTLYKPPREKTESAPAVYFASSNVNRSGRTEYVESLIHFMDVDSYGRSLNNRVVENDLGRNTKLDTISRYKFTLAFENSISRDYVTEKFFQPLEMGSVPVYMGAPNVAQFAPDPMSYIDVNNLAGPAELAAQLLWLAENPTEYAKYLEWKSRPPNSSFAELVGRFREPPFCRLAELLLEMKDRA